MQKRRTHVALWFVILWGLAACTSQPAVTPFPTIPSLVNVPTRSQDSLSSDPDAQFAATAPAPTAEPTQPATAEPTTPPEPTNTPIVIVCVPRSSWATYTVQAGDTISRIAGRFGTTSQEIIDANCLSNPNLIEVGQALFVPPTATPTSPPPTATDTPADEWVRYTDLTFQVGFNYPSGWQRNAVDYSTPRLEGSSGFVALNALSGPETVEEAAAQEANHRLMPYGANPTIERFFLPDGREGRLIMPSADQATDMALFVVAYAQPADINGTTYAYLTVTADTGHMREILKTLEMLDG